MNTPFEVVHDNLATRSIRVSIDLVDDEVNQALNKVHDSTHSGLLSTMCFHYAGPCYWLNKKSFCVHFTSIVQCNVCYHSLSYLCTQEVEVVNGIKDKLQQKVNEAFQQLWYV